MCFLTNSLPYAILTISKFDISEYGLLTIVTQGFALYTGKIGFIKSPKELFDMLIIIAGNFAGTFLTAPAQ